MKAGEFIQRSFHVRTAAHDMHLKTTSYAKHVALNGFYDDLIPLIDAYAEAYQGKYGLIDSYHGTFRQYATPEALVEDYVNYIEDSRSEFYGKGDSFLSNIVDEVLALSYSTLYKLRCLK